MGEREGAEMKLQLAATAAPPPCPMPASSRAAIERQQVCTQCVTSVKQRDLPASGLAGCKGQHSLCPMTASF